MIILDTNVVSEPLKARGSEAVRDWLDRQAAETLYLTTTSLAELLFGVERLPDGKRKLGLAADLADLLTTLFGDRLLTFDQESARAFGAMAARAEASGVKVPFADGQIAAVARAKGFAVATRDEAPFRAAGVPVINPWKEASPGS